MVLSPETRSAGAGSRSRRAILAVAAALLMTTPAVAYAG